MDTIASRAWLAALAIFALGLTAPSASSEPFPAPDASDGAIALTQLIPDDGALMGYEAPIRIDAHVRAFVGFHVHLSGSQVYQRPASLALDVAGIPNRYRDLFAEIGMPTTWATQYTLRIRARSDDASGTTYIVDGTPRHPQQIAQMELQFSGVPSGTIVGTWRCTDGSTITMTMQQSAVSGYELPSHIDAVVRSGILRADVAIDYGPYAVRLAGAARELKVAHLPRKPRRTANAVRRVTVAYAA